MANLDVLSYKQALDAGNRGQIVAKARALVLESGARILLPMVVNVNASHGADNSAEIERHKKVFNTNALAFTKTLESYNQAAASGGDAKVEAKELSERFLTLEHSDACLTEIARIEKGDSFGTGGGFDKVGEPPYVKRLEDLLKEILQEVRK